MKTRTKSIFKVGDKVKRIDIGRERCYSYQNISYGKTYVIRKIEPWEHLDGQEAIIYLQGFANNQGMCARRFVKARRK